MLLANTDQLDFERTALSLKDGEIVPIPIQPGEEGGAYVRRVSRTLARLNELATVGRYRLTDAGIQYRAAQRRAPGRPIQPLRYAWIDAIPVHGHHLFAYDKTTMSVPAYKKMIATMKRHARYYARHTGRSYTWDVKDTRDAGCGIACYRVA